MTALHAMTAAELSDGYRRGAFTPLEVLHAIHQRTDLINPSLNAIIAEDRIAARAMALASAGRWHAGQPLSPLDGVPITIKDNLVAEGLPATWGSRLYAHNVPAADEAPIARLRAAGAVVIGKTNCPEFTLQGYTGNDLFGVTTNPIARGRTPGGSTGGGAAAVAAGLGPVAIGTDGGGSLRRPAAHCGLFGWKPSLGAVSRAGGFPQLLYNFETVGPLARGADDLRLVADVLCESPRTAFPARPRIGFFRTVADAPIDTAIASAADAFAAHLRVSRQDIADMAAPFVPGVINGAWSVVAAFSLARLLDELDPDRQTAGAFACEMADRGRALSEADYDLAVRQCDEIRAEAALLFADYDILLCPSIAALAWPVAEPYPTVIDGHPVGPRGHALFTAWGNVAGLAAVSVPVGTTADAGGIGMQFIAAQGGDHPLIDFVAAITPVAGFQPSIPGDSV